MGLGMVDDCNLVTALESGLHRPATPTAPRFYSVFDIGAMFSMHTVKNAVLVSLTSGASSLVRQLRSTTTGGLFSPPSQLLRAGLEASSRWSASTASSLPTIHESRAPFFAMAAAPTLGERIRARYS